MVSLKFFLFTLVKNILIYIENENFKNFTMKIIKDVFLEEKKIHLLEILLWIWFYKSLLLLSIIFIGVLS